MVTPNVGLDFQGGNFLSISNRLVGHDGLKVMSSAAISCKWIPAACGPTQCGKNGDEQKHSDTLEEVYEVQDYGQKESSDDYPKAFLLR